MILTTAQSKNGTVGTVTLGSNADLDLNAPSTGTFAGLVLIQDSNGLPTGTTINSPFSAKANATETLTGLVYFPDTAVTFQGGPAATGPQCLVLVANTVSMQGNPEFATSGCRSHRAQHAADRQDSRPRRVKSPMKRRPKSTRWMHDGPARGLDVLGAAGSATVEFAIASFCLIVLALGIADFGMLFNNYQALAAATRIGARIREKQSDMPDPASTPL